MPPKKKKTPTIKEEPNDEDRKKRRRLDDRQNSGPSTTSQSSGPPPPPAQNVYNPYVGGVAVSGAPSQGTSVASISASSGFHAPPAQLKDDRDPQYNPGSRRPAEILKSEEGRAAEPHGGGPSPMSINNDIGGDEDDGLGGDEDDSHAVPPFPSHVSSSPFGQSNATGFNDMERFGAGAGAGAGAPSVGQSGSTISQQHVQFFDQTSVAVSQANVNNVVDLTAPMNSDASAGGHVVASTSSSTAPYYPPPAAAPAPLPYYQPPPTATAGTQTAGTQSGSGAAGYHPANLNATTQYYHPPAVHEGATTAVFGAANTISSASPASQPASYAESPNSGGSLNVTLSHAAPPVGSLSNSGSDDLESPPVIAARGSTSYSLDSPFPIPGSNTGPLTQRIDYVTPASSTHPTTLFPADNIMSLGQPLYSGPPSQMAGFIHFTHTVTHQVWWEDTIFLWAPLYEHFLENDRVLLGSLYPILQRDWLPILDRILRRRHDRMEYYPRHYVLPWFHQMANAISSMVYAPQSPSEHESHSVYVFSITDRTGLTHPVWVGHLPFPTRGHFQTWSRWVDHIYFQVYLPLGFSRQASVSHRDYLVHFTNSLRRSEFHSRYTEFTRIYPPQFVPPFITILAQMLQGNYNYSAVTSDRPFEEVSLQL
jgi:hypothetical protein